MKFARNFTALRKKIGITQEQMAERCGVSRGALAKWENGVTVPNLYMVDEISKIFNVTVDELMHGDIENVPDNSIERFAGQLDRIEKMLSSRSVNFNLDLYEEYCDYCSKEEYNNEESIPSDAYAYFGMEAVDKGNYEEAIKYYEAALTHGDIYVIEPIMEIYNEILDIYAYQEKEAEYLKFKLELAQKMQQYGRIMEKEIKKRLLR